MKVNMVVLRLVILLRSFLLAFNVIFAVALVLSYFASAISPAQFWPLSFFGLAFPFLLVMNLMFVALWAIQQHYLMFLSLFVILIGWSHLNNFFTISFSKEERAESVRIMSYNVQNFNLYNWNENIRSRDSMLALAYQLKPDIICFQEFYTSDGGEFKMIPAIKELLEMEHYYFQNTFTTRDTNHWGIAIFSKYPIVDKGYIEFPNSRSNACIYADININDKPVRIYNMHLQSFHFGNRDYRYIDQVLTEQESDMEASRLLMGKVKRAYVKRARQADTIKIHMNQSSRPVIVCGDFNDTPVSYTYDVLSEGLQDAFLKKGSGIGHTYAGKLPGLRIDYIMMDPALEVVDFVRIRNKVSDHYPIYTDFVLP